MAKKDELEELKKKMAKLQKEKEESKKVIETPETPETPEKPAELNDPKLQPIFFSRQDYDRMIYETYMMVSQLVKKE